MKKRIMFVDDDSTILQGLRRLLRRRRAEWDMVFVEDGETALETIGQSDFDVIVTDMRMPGMDGAQLLTAVREKHPQIARIILSGQSDKEASLKSVGPAHQFLSKPCDPDVLMTCVSRSLQLRDLLAHDKLQSLTSHIGSLPSLPNIYTEIVQALQSENASIHDIGKIVSKDIGMTAKILQLVNSSFFGLPRRITDPAQAAGLLGLETIGTLVLSVNVFSQFSEKTIRKFALNDLWSHSMAVGVNARAIADSLETADKKVAEDAFLAGILHDIGKLILASELPEEYGEALDLAKREEISPVCAEDRVFGTTHAEIGAYLLGLWGMPDAIIEAVAFHHYPEQSLGKTFGPLTAVHAANAIPVTGLIHVADALEHAEEQDQLPENDKSIHIPYIERLGLQDRIPDWLEMCQKLAEETATHE